MILNLGKFEHILYNHIVYKYRTKSNLTFSFILFLRFHCCARQIDGSYNIAAKTIAIFKEIVTKQEWNSAE